MKVGFRTRRHARTAIVLILVALASSTESYAQKEPPGTGGVEDNRIDLPLTIQDFENQMNVPTIKQNPKRYIEEIERRKISFLPTRELKDRLRDKAPKEVLDALNKNIALYLQVSEFACGNCTSGSKDGEAFAREVLDQLKAVTLLPNLGTTVNPLFKRSYSPQLGPIGGLEKIRSPHVYLVVNGKLSKEGGQERIAIDLAYINAGFLALTTIESHTWSMDGTSSRHRTAQQIADWVARSFSAAIP